VAAAAVNANSRALRQDCLKSADVLIRLTSRACAFGAQPIDESLAPGIEGTSNLQRRLLGVVANPVQVGAATEEASDF
jgi:hypothetical protein